MSMHTVTDRGNMQAYYGAECHSEGQTSGPVMLDMLSLHNAMYQGALSRNHTWVSRYGIYKGISFLHSHTYGIYKGIAFLHTEVPPTLLTTSAMCHSMHFEANRKASKLTSMPSLHQSYGVAHLAISLTAAMISITLVATAATIVGVGLEGPCCLQLQGNSIITIIIITFKVAQVNRQTANAVEDTKAAPQGLSAPTMNQYATSWPLSWHAE